MYRDEKFVNRELTKMSAGETIFPSSPLLSTVTDPVMKSIEANLRHLKFGIRTARRNGTQEQEENKYSLL